MGLREYLDRRKERAEQKALQKAIKTLTTVHARILGFVLNDVDLNAARRGYYAYKYRYPYYHYTYRYYSRYAEDGEGEGGAPVAKG